MIKALVRKSDNLLDISIEPQISIENPDVETYMVVDTELASVADYQTISYRWNSTTSSFYSCGPRPPTITETTHVVTEAFASDSNYHFRGTGFTFAGTSNGTTTWDVSIPSERKFNGLDVWIDKEIYGVTVNLQVIDKDGLYSPANTILNQFGFDWQICPSGLNRIKAEYPATLYAGLYLRMKLVTPSSDMIQVYGNLRLHEKKES